MSKILAASCDAQGKVTCEGVVIPSAVVMSAGKQASQGLLLLEGGTATYFTMNTTDLETTLDKLITVISKAATALTQAATALTSLDGKPTGGTGSAVVPLVASNVSQINSAVSDLNAVSSEISDLKGALK